MAADKIDGAKNRIAGSIKEAIGKVTGDKSTEIEGKTQKIAGKAEGDLSEAKGAASNRVKK